MTDTTTRTQNWPIGDSWHEKHAPVLLPTDKLTAPSVDIFDEPTRCYTINKQWAPIVMGMASLLTDIKMWQGAEDENFSAIQQVMEFLEGSTCAMLDCNAVLACLAADGGYQTIITSISNLYGFEADKWYGAVDAAYTTTLQSAWPDIPITAPAANSTDDFLLCAAVYAVVAGFAANKLFILAEAPEEAPSLWETVKNVALEVVGFFYGWFRFLVNNIRGDRTLSDAQDALSDQLAIIDAACCLYNELRSAPVSESSWDAALVACKAATTGNTNAILDMMALSEKLDNSIFYAFGQSWATTIERHNTGASLYCPCQNEFIHVFDFTTSPEGWTAEIGGGSYGNSSWVSGLGFVAALEIDNARRVGVESAIALTPTYGISFTLDVVGAISGFNHTANAYIDGVFAGAPVQDTFNVLSDTANQQFSLPLSPAKNTDYFRLRASVIPSTGFERLVITRATVRGTGSDPFV